MKEKIKNIFFFAFFLAAVIINIISLKNGHIWGEDFSQYIIHAQNILEGRPYSSGIMLDLPIIFPPGLPFILMGIIKLFGVNFQILKSINIPFWFASIGIIYFLFKSSLKKETLLGILVLFSFSSFFFVFKQNVISDIPFLFFALLSILLFIKGVGSEAVRENVFYWAIFIAGFSYLIRTAGLAIFIAIIYYLIVAKNDFKRAFIVIFGFVVAFLVQLNFTHLDKAFFMTIKSNPMQYLNAIWQNNSLPVRSMAWLLIPGQTPVTSSLYLLLDKILLIISPILYLAFYAIFIFRSFKKRIIFLECFAAVYLGIILIWAGFPHHPSNFARFCLPIIMIVVVFLLGGINKVKNGMIITRSMLVVLIALNIFNIYRNFNFNDDVLYKKENQELFSWIKENVREDEHYMIWQSRPVALMTGIIGTAPWIDKIGVGNDFVSRAEILNISYIIMNKGLDNRITNDLMNHPEFTKIIWENQNYQIFKVLSYAK